MRLYRYTSYNKIPTKLNYRKNTNCLNLRIKCMYDGEREYSSTVALTVYIKSYQI